MKVVIFGDVHGNLLALEELFYIEENFADLFICHGDIVNYGPWSKECVKFLEFKKNTVCLAGNHEHFFCRGVIETENSLVKCFFDHCYKRFPNEQLKQISKYHESHYIGDFEVTHTILNKYIYKDTELKDIDLSNNYIIGHSHQQYERKVGRYTIANTGSLGQNREFINVAEYLRYDTTSQIIEFCSFNFDVNQLIREMQKQGYPKNCIHYYESKDTIELT